MKTEIQAKATKFYEDRMFYFAPKTIKKNEMPELIGNDIKFAEFMVSHLAKDYKFFTQIRDSYDIIEFAIKTFSNIMKSDYQSIINMIDSILLEDQTFTAITEEGTTFLDSDINKKESESLLRIIQLAPITLWDDAIAWKSRAKMIKWLTQQYDLFYGEKAFCKYIKEAENDSGKSLFCAHYLIPVCKLIKADTKQKAHEIAKKNSSLQGLYYSENLFYSNVTEVDIGTSNPTPGIPNEY